MLLRALVYIYLWSSNPPTTSTEESPRSRTTHMAPRIVIGGAGLHGAALAYYLSLRGEAPLVVERHSVAAAASGKRWPYRDWGSGQRGTA